MNHPDDAQLAALDAGTLSPADAIALRRHVDDCEACLARLDALATATVPGSPPGLTDARRIGRYVVLGELGEGGMGRVLRAWDPQLNRACALKLLKGNSKDPEARARLVREAQAMARVQHPNIVAVFDAGEADGEVFMAMELVEGPTLDDWLKARPRTWQEVLARMLEAAQGLRAAHEAGLVHRDFKPQNVLLRDGVAKVNDFGLARGPVAGLPSATPSESVGTTSSITVAGLVMGSPAYMAPEQRRGEADARSDQYAFGVTLFEGLHGHRPRDAGPLRPVPRWVSSLVAKLLVEDPAQRFSSMGEVIEALEGGLRRRRLRAQGSIAAAVLLVLLSVFLLDRRARDTRCAEVDAPAKLAWPAQERARVKQGWAALAAPWATRAFDALDAKFSAFTEAWSRQRTEACVAARVRGETSDQLYTLQGLCFERSLGRARAVVHTLGAYSPTDDEAAATDALSALGRQLPDLAACGDGEALLRAGTAESIELQRDALPLRARLDEVFALSATGEGDRALTLARALSKETALVRNPALHAEALSAEGQFEARFGTQARAAPLLREAWQLAFAAQADSIALRAFFELLPTLAKDATSLELATLVANGIIDRLGRTPTREGDLAFIVGNLHLGFGDYAAAVTDYERAVKLFTGVSGPGDSRTLDAKTNLSIAYLRVDRVDESVQLSREVADAVLALHGPDSMLTVVARSNWASQLVAARHDAEALPILEATLTSLERRRGVDQHVVLSVIDNLAFATMREGGLDRALKLRDQQVELAMGFSAEPAILASAKAWRAELRLHRGEPQEALEDARAAAVGFRAQAKDYPDLPWALTYEAEALAALGAIDDARRALHEAETVGGVMGEDLRAQVDLAQGCVARPGIAAQQGAEKARAWFAAQQGYGFELALASDRLANALSPVTKGRCSWR